jgi:proteasome accessory factor C
VGQRSQTETLAGVYQAFLQRRTWKQAELARELGVSVEAVRRILNELRANGMPLDREEDHPHVYWSVPKDWFPGSVLFKKEEIPELLRQLRRVPFGHGRARLLSIVLARLPKGAAPAASPVVVREASDEEEQYLGAVEDAASSKRALYMRYFTASRGDVGDRFVSVHRVDVGPPARIIATCHRSGVLKTFRVDSIMSARVDAAEPFRAAGEAEIDAYVKASLDGYNQGGALVSCSFVVRNPEARWVKKNLLEGMAAEVVEGGIRVSIQTTSLGRLARYVVGLGAAATPEAPPALVGEVRKLAQGALEVLDSIEDRRSGGRAVQ